jgi:hypothetical protein
VLEVVLEVEPTLVPAAIGARQRRRDVLLPPPLLRPEIGIPDCRRDLVILQADELEEVPEEMPMGTHTQVPLAQCLECCHLLDVVRVEMLELQPILVEHHTDE